MRQEGLMKRPPARYKHRYMVRLDDNQLAALESEVARSGIPGAELVRKALDLYLAGLDTSP
jgi:predicted DNA binding CopG/RHH family protein